VVRAAAEGVVELPELTTAYWRWREHDIRYTRAGTHGPAVLCVHGFGGNCDHWRKNVAQLAANGFRCSLQQRSSLLLLSHHTLSSLQVLRHRPPGLRLQLQAAPWGPGRQRAKHGVQL
jgi:hypothetical protein